MKIYPITPIGKPRMTQRDKWKKRPVVQRYYSFKDQVRLHKVILNYRNQRVIFVIPMPKSWPKVKRDVFKGTEHQQKPDIDNLFKALADSIFKDDSHISDIRISKIWGDEGAIIII